jgi:membrane protein implicated in regulation of membrane protease activity
MSTPTDGRSALNLRLLLSLGGAATSLLLGLFSLRVLPAGWGIALLLLAAVGVVDAVVVQRRRSDRAQAHRGADHWHDSLFE